MNTATMELNALRGELAHTLFCIDDMNILRKVKRAVDRCVKSEVETEYIDKAEVLESIREGLREVKEARRTGEKLMTAEELLKEL